MITWQRYRLFALIEPQGVAVAGCSHGQVSLPVKQLAQGIITTAGGTEFQAFDQVLTRLAPYFTCRAETSEGQVQA